jgi:hypothetical protein
VRILQLDRTADVCGNADATHACRDSEDAIRRRLPWLRQRYDRIPLPALHDTAVHSPAGGVGASDARG